MAWSELEPFQRAEPDGDRRFVPAAARADTKFIPHVRPLGVDPSNTMIRGAASQDLEPVDVDEIRKEAYAQGEAAGRAQLPWEDAAALRRAIAALDDAAIALSRNRRSQLIESRRAIVDLAGAMAERIVARTLALDRSALAALVGEAIESFEPAESLVVALSPSDLEVVQLALSREAGAVPPGRALRFEADASLEPSCARISGRSGDARAAMDLALARIRAGLEELLAVGPLVVPDESNRDAALPTTLPQALGSPPNEETAADAANDPTHEGTEDAPVAAATGRVAGSGTALSGGSRTRTASPADEGASVAVPVSPTRARRTSASGAESAPTPAPARPRRKART